MKKMISILVLFLIVNCEKSTEFQSFEITPVLVSKGEYFNPNYNPTRHGEVFSNAVAWDEFVTNSWGIATVPDAANVNFEEHQVIASFDQPWPTGGHSIDIISVVENSENIVVVVDKLNNGDFTQMPTRPYHFVKIPISTKPIIFN